MIIYQLYIKEGVDLNLFSEGKFMDDKDAIIQDLELQLKAKDNLGKIVDLLLQKLSKASDPYVGLGDAFEVIKNTYAWERMDYFALDEIKGDLFIKVSTAKNGSAHQRFDVNEGIVGKVLAEGERYLTNDVAKDDNFLFYREEGNRDYFNGKSYLAVPINSMGKTIGVITFLADRDISEADARIAEDTLRLVTPYLQLMVSNDNMRRIVSYNEQLSLDNLSHQAVLLDTMNPYTAGHSVRVTEFADRLAQVMKLDPQTVGYIQHTSLWHDIGKRGVPGGIIKKPETLTDEEREEMKHHPLFGYRIIKPMLTVPIPVKQSVLCHHEWYGGSEFGYPSGRSHADLNHNPIITGVIGVADAWDAMNSMRSYREPISIDNALAELTKFSRTQFNPQVVKAFMSDKEHLVGLTQRLMDTKPDDLSYTQYITRLQKPSQTVRD